MERSFLRPRVMVWWGAWRYGRVDALREGGRVAVGAREGRGYKGGVEKARRYKERERQQTDACAAPAALTRPDPTSDAPSIDNSFIFIPDKFPPSARDFPCRAPPRPGLSFRARMATRGSA